MPLDAVTRQGFFTNLLTAGTGGVARLVTSDSSPPSSRAWVVCLSDRHQILTTSLSLHSLPFTPEPLGDPDD